MPLLKICPREINTFCPQNNTDKNVNSSSVYFSSEVFNQNALLVEPCKGKIVMYYITIWKKKLLGYVII